MQDKKESKVVRHVIFTLIGGAVGIIATIVQYNEDKARWHSNTVVPKEMGMVYIDSTLDTTANQQLLFTEYVQTDLSGPVEMLTIDSLYRAIESDSNYNIQPHSVNDSLHRIYFRCTDTTITHFRIILNDKSNRLRWIRRANHVRFEKSQDFEKNNPPVH
jgi:hypothetical protein